MSWVAVGVTAASMVMSLSAGGKAEAAAGREADLTRRAGVARRDAADFEASVLEVQAGQTIAATQRDALDIRRMTRLAISRQIAVAAASGGGASTAPTVHSIVATTAKDGYYNAARALYAGEEKARIMRLNAIEARKQGEFYMGESGLAAEAIDMRGDAQRDASIAGALSSGAGLYAKYGGRGWTNTTASNKSVMGDYNWEIGNSAVA